MLLVPCISASAWWTWTVTCYVVCGSGCTRMSADIRVSVSCVVVALFGLRLLIKGYSVTRSVRQPARGALEYTSFYVSSTLQEDKVGNQHGNQVATLLSQ